MAIQWPHYNFSFCWPYNDHITTSVSVQWPHYNFSFCWPYSDHVATSVSVGLTVTTWPLSSFSVGLTVATWLLRLVTVLLTVTRWPLHSATVRRCMTWRRFPGGTMVARAVRDVRSLWATCRCSRLAARTSQLEWPPGGGTLTSWVSS